MATSGQKMQATLAEFHQASRVSAEQAAEKEAKRIKEKIDSLAQAFEQAKADFTKAVEAGTSQFHITSKIYARSKRHATLNPAFAYISRLICGRLLPDDVIMQPTWDAFQAWAASEDIHVKFTHKTSEYIDGEEVEGCFFLLNARLITAKA